MEASKELIDRINSRGFNVANGQMIIQQDYQELMDYSETSKEQITNNEQIKNCNENLKRELKY